MKPSPILVSLDSNERGSERAKALARAVGGDPAYDLHGFAELPVDMCLKIRDEDPIRGTNLCNISEQVVNVELKEIPDFWASKSSGHLGQQILEMVAAGSPAFVAVFGSLQEVLESVPKMKMWENHSGMMKPQRRSQMDVQQDLSTARAFCADAAGCGVPVHFLSTNHEQSFRWILSYAKNILLGPNMASWLPRMGCDPVGYGMLCALRNIGDTTARKILENVGPFDRLPWKDVDNQQLVNVVGKAKSRAILEGFGVE